MKYLLPLFFVITAQTLSAQILVTDNKNILFNGSNFSLPAGNIPLSGAKIVEISEGSMFFQNDWAKSKILTEDFNEYQGISTKVNLMDNKILYLDSLGKEFIVGIPVRQISFIQKSNGKEVQFINGNILPVKKSGWQLLLINDSLSLIKSFKKTLQQHTSYGSATEYSIKTEENYFLYLKNNEYEIKRASDVAEILPAKSREIELYIKNLSKKLSREDQLTSVVTFCNSLLK